MSSSSIDSVVSSTGDWDQPENVVDTLGLPSKPVQSVLERKLKSKFSFDNKWKEFSDVRLYDIQNSERFHELYQTLKFPFLPLYSSILCCANKKSQRFKFERFVQRKICHKFCYWNPSNCFLEDSHSGKFEDLMSEELHNLHNPEFKDQFSEEYIYPQLVYPGRYNPPYVNKLIDSASN